MTILNSATTSITYRSVYAATLKCVRLSIIAFFTLLFACCGIPVEGAAGGYEFHAFADFLEQQNLRYAIVGYNSEMLPLLQQEELQEMSTLRSLAEMTSLQFYDVQRMKTAKNFTDFKKLLYYDSPRVGIYLTQLEDVLLQEHVLGTDVLTNAAPITLESGGFRVRVDVGARFNNSQAWFIMSKEWNVKEAKSNVRRVMTLLPLNISADITLGVRVDKNNTIQLFDVYKIQHEWLEIEPKGYWSPIFGLQLKKRFRQSYIRRRRNFKSLQLRAGIVVRIRDFYVFFNPEIREKPENMKDIEYLNSLDYKMLDTMQRKTYQMLKMIEPMFDVSFQAKFTKLWGEHSPNGSWNGVMAMLLTGEAELSLCPMRFVSNRVHLVHYSSAVHTEYIFFLFRHPRRNDIRNIFFTPFVEEVWYSVAAVIILTILLLQLHLRHENRFLLNKDSHFECRFDYAILSILEAFFMQGPSHNAFSADSTRTLIFFVCLFSLLLQQFYGAFIVGSLLAVSPRTITNLDALYNSSLEIGMESIPYNFEIFQNHKSPLINAVYTKRICKNRERHILTIEEGAERIREGGFAFHVSANRMYIMLRSFLTEKEFCELQEVSFIPPFHTGIAVAKNSPFREYFMTAILKLRTSGLMQHNDNQWQIQKMDCSLSQNHEVEVDLQHFLPAIMLLASVMLLSIGVLISEVIYYNLEYGLKLARFCPFILPKHKIEFIN